jgi:hypothetical protein
MTQIWRWFGVGHQRSVADDPTLSPTPFNAFTNAIQRFHQREPTHATIAETRAVAAFIRGLLHLYVDNHRHTGFYIAVLHMLRGNSTTAVASTCTVH